MLASLFFVSAHKDSATRHGCAPAQCVSWGECVPVARKLRRRSRLPPRSVLGAPHWGAAPEPAGETSPSLHLHHAMEELPSLSLLYSVLSHPFSPVLNRSHPLQHPKRTRFRLFRAESGAFFSFLLFLGRKIFACSFVHPAA